MTGVQVLFCLCDFINLYVHRLDLKDNVLEEPLKGIAGDCLNDAQCRACATKVKISSKAFTLLKAFLQKNRRSVLKLTRQLYCKYAARLCAIILFCVIIKYAKSNAVHGIRLIIYRLID